MMIDPSRSHYVVDALSQLGIKITNKQIAQMESAVIHFEIRGSNPLTLNGQTIGVYPIAFIDSDRSALFHIFGIEESDMRDAIEAIPTIQKEWKVASDPFNVLCAWVMHLAFIYIRQDRIRHAFLMNVAKYLHYRFFTSIVNHNFIHGANEGVMQAAINSLSRKYDLVVYGSWRKTIEARCEDLISNKSIHYDVLQTGSPDKAFVYLLSDIQSRLRDKIGNITEIYYTFHREGVTIDTQSTVKTDADGEKILTQKTSVFDSTITNMTQEILNLVSFLDSDDIKLVTSKGSSVSPDLLRAVIVDMSELAASQVASRQFDQVEKTKHGTIDVGMRVLIANLLRTSYAFCINNGVNMNSKIAIYQALRNAYSSSRIADPDILRVRNSMANFVDKLGRTKREATLSALRICVIMYVVVRSFQYLPSR